MSSSHPNKSDNTFILTNVRRAVAATAIVFGLVLFVFGSWWAPFVLELLSGSRLGSWLELIVPFLPLLFVGLGAMFLPYGRDQKNSVRR